MEGFIHPGVEFLHDIGTGFVHVFQVALFEVDYVVKELGGEDQIAESPEGFVRSHQQQQKDHGVRHALHVFDIWAVVLLLDPNLEQSF